MIGPGTGVRVYTEALGALVAHVGADAKVRDSARILRLGGTVNWITDPGETCERLH